MRRTSLILLPVLLAVVALTGTRVPDDDFYAMRKNFEIFGSFYEELVGTYVSRIDPEPFMRTGIDAMLTTLDPWTDFYDEADNAEMDLRGRRLLGDVGLSIGRRDGQLTVLPPEHESAAYRQGVQTGDVLLMVDRQPVDSLSVPEVHHLLRGEPGTLVEVKVRRTGEGEVEFHLRREAPVQQSVAFTGLLPDDPEIAYLKLDMFGNQAGAELASAYRELTENRTIKGVILDLRGNPGGLVSEAVSVSGLFLERGAPIVSMRGRASSTNRLFRTENDPLAPDLPLAVLMNRSSASASEIVAGAIQDLDRGVIVGEASFGKGLVQVVRPLPYSTSLKVTMSAYFTPSGRGIRKDHGQPGVTEPTFTTAAGRTIREGYGIEPEVVIEKPVPGPLETALEREAAFFLFADVIVERSGEAIRSAAEVSGRIAIPDGTLDEFRRWLDGRAFTFTTPLEDELDRLSLDDGSSSVRSAFRELRDAAAAERNGAFAREAERLTERLTEETAARLLGPVERIRASLAGDAEVERAREVLRDGARYRRLLDRR